jgi:hypothetical protein
MWWTELHILIRIDACGGTQHGCDFHNRWDVCVALAANRAAQLSPHIFRKRWPSIGQCLQFSVRVAHRNRSIGPILVHGRPEERGERAAGEAFLRQERQRVTITLPQVVERCVTAAGSGGTRARLLLLVEHTQYAARAELAHERPAFVGYEYVCGTQAAVRNASSVRASQHVGQLLEDRHEHSDHQWAAGIE